MADVETRMKGIKAEDLLEKCKTFLGKGWSDVNESNFDFHVLTLFTIDEFCDDRDISAAIARALSHYHSLQLPVPKVQKALPTMMRNFHKQHVNNLKTKGTPELPEMSERCTKAVNALLYFDFTTEADWIEKVSDQIRQRIVFRHGDANRGNTLFRLAEKDEDGRPLTLDERILLIDYEFSSCGPRGIDIGCHFGLQVHDFGQKLWLMHKEFPNEARRRAFVEAYASECKQSKLYKDWDEDGLDSVENIMLEADFGYLCGRMFMLSFCQLTIEGFGKMHIMRKDVDPEFTEQGGFASFIYCYQDRKEAFLQKYPHFA